MEGWAAGWRRAGPTLHGMRLSTAIGASSSRPSATTPRT